jgi:hypothetical protein
MSWQAIVKDLVAMAICGMGQGLGNDMPSLMNVALGRNGDGYLEVLATSTVVGSEPTVWHAEENPDGRWSSWRQL